jgi:hypothetical protein
MWMASLDIHTGAYPVDDARPAHVGKRVYRNIDAPRGCSLYWDQPAIVAAHTLGQLTGDPRYAEAADAYVRAFLERCVARNGVFLWGNHYYYDAYRGQVMWFVSEETPRPCDMEAEDGWLHEARPIPPAWETFWRVSPQATERCIRRLSERHVFDPQSGGFNRHADGKRSHAFLEAGGILTEALCWLYDKTGDRSAADLALSIANYSWKHRHPHTGLVENNPTTDRWDKHVCTTEIGLWAGSLLRAGDLAGIVAFQDIAAQAVSAYLRYGYDETSNRYFGKLRVADGRPALGEKVTPYQPGDYADLWYPLFPAHDYPMALAESCLSLWVRTGASVYEEAIRRWVRIVESEIPANGGRGAYAEHYGRGIHFLIGAASALGDEAIGDLAHKLADEAVEVLFAEGMFGGHPGEDRYDAVDGVGFLLLALTYLQTGVDPDGMGFGF